ncbi:MAG: XRE family transcriptional regulator [Deltaproteobacteria bacterium]|nr:XRE family transcriptional regulator [Deltaproteobacteria bacterium]
MKKKSNYTKVKTADELADVLGLSKEDAIEMELRSDLNAKIIEVVKKKKFTHATVAKLAQTSRSRVTALLNGNTHNVSTSLMIRILAALGVRVRLSYIPIKIAA